MPLGSRPPPLPKGVPHPYNSIPRPPGPPPKPGLVWGQGKWRHPRSQAAKFLHKQNSQRVQKALLSPFQGKTVYAYSNIRTKQVVYSLTRVMNVCRMINLFAQNNSNRSWYSLLASANTTWGRTRELSHSSFITARRLDPPPYAATCGLLTSVFNFLPLTLVD